MNDIIKHDCIEIYDEYEEYLKKLAGKKILITGGSGFLLSYLVYLLIYFNQHNKKKINIHIVDQNIQKFLIFKKDKNLKLIKSNISNLKKFYEFTEERFDAFGILHKTNFEGSKNFKKFRYIFGHILWAKQSIKKILKEHEDPSVFFTRSDWIFYFLSRNNKPVAFECHKLTGIRKKLIRIAIKKDFSKIIFINELI